ncbi:MAG: DNA-processing protein DprA [Oscillospiraceae bacterium]|nr:DNA-processing protein DprA [Oscillospiraceae bacterium]
MDNKRYWIWLTMIFTTGSSRIWELLNQVSDPETAYQNIIDGKFRLTDHEAANLRKVSPESADAVIDLCIKKNISIYTYENREYPDILKTIYNPPAVIYCRGSISCFENSVSLTVVGTRHPSPYGLRAAGQISRELAECGFTIVSGFADGIDSAAHRGALEAGGKTAAVLGCGVDVDYPKANSDIRDAVIENGALISEFAPGTTPNGRNFPIRNRILSGISLGVFVAEAPSGSGALITADYAAEQGRDVFCLPPHDIFDKKYSGVVKYLRDGAIPVFGYTDIMYEYYTTYSHKLSTLTPEDEYSQGVTESALYSKHASKKKPLSQGKPDKKTVSPDISGLSDIQRKIISAIGQRQMSVNDIQLETNIETSQLLCEMTELELLGAVRSLPGKMYELC